MYLYSILLLIYIFSYSHLAQSEMICGMKVTMKQILDSTNRFISQNGNTTNIFCRTHDDLLKFDNKLRNSECKKNFVSIYLINHL